MGYQSALVAAGCEVLEFEEFGDYQGSWYALVRLNNEIGLVEGNYGSCSGCDAFEAEFNYNDDTKPDYQERLSAFGEGYLPALPIDLRIDQLADSLKRWDWSDDREALQRLKEWKVKHNI